MARIQRRALGALAGASLLAAGSRAGWAQGSYPARPVRLVVPYPPGWATDVIARLIGERLSARWGRPVVVENRAGGGDLRPARPRRCRRRRGGNAGGDGLVGRVRTDDMRRCEQPVELRLMRAIKDALDPTGLLNPGVLLP